MGTEGSADRSGAGGGVGERETLICHLRKLGGGGRKC